MTPVLSSSPDADPLNHGEIAATSTEQTDPDIPMSREPVGGLMAETPVQSRTRQPTLQDSAVAAEAKVARGRRGAPPAGGR